MAAIILSSPRAKPISPVVSPTFQNRPSACESFKDYPMRAGPFLSLRMVLEVDDEQGPLPNHLEGSFCRANAHPLSSGLTARSTIGRESGRERGGQYVEIS